MGEFERERHHHDAVEPERLGDLGLLVSIGQTEHERGRREHVAWVRLEGEHQRRHAERGGTGLQRPKHVLMTAVAAVEIADRDHGAAQRRRNLVESSEPDEAAQIRTRLESDGDMARNRMGCKAAKVGGCYADAVLEHSGAARGRPAKCSRPKALPGTRNPRTSHWARAAGRPRDSESPARRGGPALRRRCRGRRVRPCC